MSDTTVNNYIRRLVRPRLVPVADVMNYMVHHIIVHGKTHSDRGTYDQEIGVMLVDPNDRQKVHYHLYTKDPRTVKRIMSMIPRDYRAWLRDTQLNDKGYDNPGVYGNSQGRVIEMRSTYSFEEPPWRREPCFFSNVHTTLKHPDKNKQPSSFRVGPYWKIKAKPKTEEVEEPKPAVIVHDTTVNDEPMIEIWGKKVRPSEVEQILIDCSVVDDSMSYNEKAQRLKVRQAYADAVRAGEMPGFSE